MNYKIGQKVLYKPFEGSPTFSGTVASIPWVMGKGQIVIDLADLPEAFGEYMKLSGTPKLWAAELDNVIPEEKGCHWHKQHHGSWLTDCGNTYYKSDPWGTSSPMEDGFAYCPYCSHQLVQDTY